ncbi:MAG: hypothetical protein E7315_06100 [Clostridiales bacterium]|nr:hypothetical protein [Clostridiales bacterium]
MYFDDIKMGTVLNIGPVTIEKEKMMAFAKDYDSAPVHLDEEYARKTVFGDIIAPGVMSFMSLWRLYRDVDIFGDEMIAGKSTKIEWIKPVYAEDILTAHVEVTNLTRRNARNGIVELTFFAYNQKNELVLTNVTETIVKCREDNGT